MAYSLTLSARSKDQYQSIQDFLQSSFNGIELDNIDSIFAFSDPCKLYGGRTYIGYELSHLDLKWMYDHNIGYRIPLSNFLATDAIYESELKFLKKHHRKGNSVIVMKDVLAERIKNDFPLYSVECSVTKQIDNAEDLKKALELYDTVVPLPKAFNTNYELLESFTQDIKDRIRLFLNVGCAYNCPARTCYASMSKMNLGIKGTKFECSQLNKKQYIPSGMTDFDIEDYLDRGYTKFKVLRVKQTPIPTGF